MTDKKCLKQVRVTNNAVSRQKTMLTNTKQPEIKKTGNLFLTDF